MEERKCKGKGAIIILSILLVLSLVAGGYFYYKNANKINDLEEQLKNNKNEQVVSNDNENSGNLEVRTIPEEEVGRGYFMDKNMNEKVIIPEIVNGTKVTEKINNKILKRYINEVDAYAYLASSNLETKNTSRYNKDTWGVSVNYDKIIKNNVLFMTVQYEKTAMIGGNPDVIQQIKDTINYVYDIENDKEIKITDGLLKMGYSQEELDNLIKKSTPKEAQYNNVSAHDTLNNHFCGGHVEFDKNQNVIVKYNKYCNG